MHEIRLLKAQEPRTIEIESVDNVPEDPAQVPPDPVYAERVEEVRWSAYISPSDRRVAQRYRAKEGRCWVGWHDGDNFRQSAAWIIDISASGGLVATDASPPEDRSFWLRLDNPAVPDWAEVRLVALQSSQGGIFAARVVFRGTCPYAFIKAAAFDATTPQVSKSAPSSSWNFNSW